MSAESNERLERLGSIAKELFPKVMQKILKKCKSPRELQVIYQLNNRPTEFTESEISLMEKLPNLDNFTTELCFKILRFENLLHEPSCKWGNVPQDTEVEIGDDVQRILNATSDVIYSRRSEEISELYYKEFHNRTQQLLKRVDAYLGQDTCLQLYQTIHSSDMNITDMLQELTLMQEVNENTTTEESVIQAHTPVNYNLPVSATLRQQFNIEKSTNENLRITSYTKTGNALAFTDFWNRRLIICNTDGTDIHHMSLPYQPLYITEINIDTVAVSCTKERIIPIINISTGSVTSTINTSGYCYGISYNDNNLYVVIDKRIVHVTDLTGKVIRTLPLPSDRIWDITVDRDRLVCIERTSIYCCSLDGKLVWMFKKDEIQYLGGVTTDNEGNVYVTNGGTDTVAVVSDDGKHHRELLTKSDGLKRSYGMYFDKKEKILLVCNACDGEAFLFDVNKKLS